MTEFVCARCGRDLRLVAHKVDEDGERYCLACSPADDETKRTTRFFRTPIVTL
jgi:hypothetical protein